MKQNGITSIVLITIILIAIFGAIAFKLYFSLVLKTDNSENKSVVVNDTKIQEPKQQTKEESKIKDLSESNLTGKIRYISGDSRSIGVKDKIMELDLETKEFKELYSDDTKYINSLSPSGKFAAFSSDINDKCTFEFINLDTKDKYIETTDNICGGPLSPLVWWHEGEIESAFVGSTKYSLINLNTLNKALKFPKADVSKSPYLTNGFTEDGKYFVYEVTDNLFVWDGLHSNLGFISITGNSANIVKESNVSVVEKNEFICWDNHNAYILRYKYKDEVVKDTFPEPLSAQLIKLNMDDLSEEVIIDETNPEEPDYKEKVPCLKADQAEYSGIIPPKEFKAKIEELFNLVVLGVEKEQDSMYIFNAIPEEKKLEPASSYRPADIFLYDSNSEEIYVIDKGNYPTWLEL